ncbi:MAG: hypothetical protein KJ709_09135 [Nanoarchaeota archaeon]|nr:hypothetical protein [Nanoarchaeota archaeon]
MMKYMVALAVLGLLLAGCDTDIGMGPEPDYGCKDNEIWCMSAGGCRMPDLCEINSFDDCAAAGNPVAEIYPAICRTPDGRSFTQAIDEPPMILEADARSYCDDENVGQVYVSAEYIRVTSILLGGGSTYYKADGTEIHCPVVGPDSMTQECKDLQLIEDWQPVCEGLTEQDCLAENGRAVLDSEGCQEHEDQLGEIIDLPADHVCCVPK